MVTLADYAGREQAYVKHTFLENYLEVLAHKIASRYPHIVYVDGFAGPWQSANERFEDTSFGIALNALRQAKESWKQMGRNVRMSAHLVERDPAAYGRLVDAATRFPDVAVSTYSGDFTELIPIILNAIPPDAFAFFFVDPKGWRIPLRMVTPLLLRANSEIIFNFMFDFINRAVNIGDANIVAGLNELIPHGDWRSKIMKAETREDGNLTPEARKTVLVSAFTESLAKLGSYRFVAETTILRPLRDRPLYCLCYATRHPRGIEVFRDCQIKALQEQSITRAAVKLQHATKISGQAEMFESLHDMGPDELNAFLANEHQQAENSLLELTPQNPVSIQYGMLWPEVLARHVIRRAQVNELAVKLRKAQRLEFLDWEKGKRVPQQGYRVWRPQC
ncbi:MULTISPECIES: three-Cys-motif partner protein TcmP [unclassified Bradyrhizobium]|uniref:three-Cys-motif partner protein TcmP n=1 Tax=unclassified Bradyrhizobium TaxID=2631580 RepID=UPI0028EB3B72|nr:MULTISPECIES: three-Cys-motif partner protein TcmP [unclassified Bradyrhizobium]